MDASLLDLLTLAHFKVVEVYGSSILDAIFMLLLYPFLIVDWFVDFFFYRQQLHIPFDMLDIPRWDARTFYKCVIDWFIAPFWGKLVWHSIRMPFEIVKRMTI